MRVTAHARSGATSSDALSRAATAVASRPNVLVVATGGNDALRSLSPEEMEANLARIVATGQAAGAVVVLAGMEAMPNESADYRARFRAAFARTGSRPGVIHMPFLLDGVAMVPAMNQADGIHPNEYGAQRIAENLWPYVAQAIRVAAGAAEQRPTAGQRTVGSKTEDRRDGAGTGAVRKAQNAAARDESRRETGQPAAARPNVNDATTRRTEQQVKQAIEAMAERFAVWGGRRGVAREGRRGTHPRRPPGAQSRTRPGGTGVRTACGVV